MTAENRIQNRIAPAALVVLALVIAFVPIGSEPSLSLILAVLGLQLLLPVAVSLTATLSAIPLTAALCAFAAAAGWKVFPAEALPVVLLWCVGWGLISCIPVKKRLLRPVLRAALCLAAWGLGLAILSGLTGGHPVQGLTSGHPVQGLTGGHPVQGLAQAACDWVDRSPDSTEILLRAWSAGYARLQGTEALVPAVRLLGAVVIQPETRVQMLLSLRVSLEEILPPLLCSAVVYHTALTVLLTTVLPDWRRRKKGEQGEFPPMEQWYIPRKLGIAVFSLCFGWLLTLLAQDGAAAYLGRLMTNVFQAAFVLQGICWMQWMGRRMGIRSTARNLWSVILSVVMPLIPMIMGMIDQRRDARHLRPKEETDPD